eukprot:1181466-Prorocentrum_minimum.AAC.7
MRSLSEVLTEMMTVQLEASKAPLYDVLTDCTTHFTTYDTIVLRIIRRTVRSVLYYVFVRRVDLRGCRRTRSVKRKHSWDFQLEKILLSIALGLGPWGVSPVHPIYYVFVLANLDPNSKCNDDGTVGSDQRALVRLKYTFNALTSRSQ